MAAEEVDPASAALIARLMDEDARNSRQSPTPEVIDIDAPTKPSSNETTDESSPDNTTSNGERRSKRVRRRPRRFEAGFSPNFHNIGDGAASGKDSTTTTKKNDRLRQVDCEEEDPQVAPFRVVVHPCARALMELHSHLAETEVIGYLGGNIVYEEDGSVVVYVAEAFPTRCVDEKELGRQGRDAFLEVEMDPESDVEVRTRVSLKGLDIVGWYHSHPYFSCQPSTIDVENQRNYQNFIYKQKPYVAAIVGPYSEEHRDYRAELMLFYVRESDGLPVRLHNQITDDRPQQCSGAYYTIDGAAEWHISAFENEGMALISHYAEHHRRVELLAEWRDGMSTLEKLRLSLGAFTPETDKVAVSVTVDEEGTDAPVSDDIREKVCTTEKEKATDLQQKGYDETACENGKCCTPHNHDTENNGKSQVDACALQVDQNGSKGVTPQPQPLSMCNGSTEGTLKPKTLDSVIKNLMSTAEDAWRRFQKPIVIKSPKKKKRKRRIVED